MLQMAFIEKWKTKTKTVKVIKLVIRSVYLSSEFFLLYDTWPIDTSTHSHSINRILSLETFLNGYS